MGLCPGGVFQWGSLVNSEGSDICVLQLRGYSFNLTYVSPLPRPGTVNMIIMRTHKPSLVSHFVYTPTVSVQETSL